MLAVCLMGRFALDAGHWKYELAPLPSSSNDSDRKNGRGPDLVAAVLASFLIVPGCRLVWLIVLGRLHEDHSQRDKWLLFFGCCGLLGNGLIAVAASGAALHPRYENIDAVSMMGIYGVGSLTLLGSFAVIAFCVKVLDC
ncbi:hypothetical protein DL96DRAFT_121423 [Flagelloscypha sp. PMI_526]|nr:hypothetical protein DL96DRAFT_121423 [Flagelloscypha sp. PMI_526]